MDVSIFGLNIKTLIQQKSTVDLKSNIGTIKEIYPGQFQVILDFATTAFLPYLIRNEYRYIWINQHQTNNYFSWESCSLPLFDSGRNYNVVARQISFDFALPTEEFTELLPSIQLGITLTQVNILPNYYLDGRIKGKERYELLKRECDYLFEATIPSARDYGTLISCDRSYLEALLKDKNIDWTSLP
jgi:hypothetical protein